MKTYNIKTLMDFTSIPEDKVDACLADFKLFIEFCRGIKQVEANDQIKQYIKRIDVDGFDWIDDGRTGMRSATVNVKHESEAE